MSPLGPGDPMHYATSCPLAYCDPEQCGWRAGDISCEWQDEAIDTSGDGDDCDD